jgi:hypothetical protein
MGNRKSTKLGRDGLFEDNWRHFAFGAAFFFVIGAGVGGWRIGLEMAGMILLFGLIALAIGDLDG